MSSYLPMHSPSRQAIARTRLGVVLVVLLTALVSALIVQIRSQHYEINPDQIPLANMNIWRALSD
ncbi:MAG: hypothetical protein AAFQ89_07980 [Cyanobacteria bacterium J06626_18]